MQEITHGRVLAIALPIVLSNATVPILGAVDTAVVGQIGSAVPIGAVGLGAIILTSLLWLFGFLRMGTSGLVAQAAGRGDRDEVAAHLLRALCVAGVAGGALICLQVPLISAALALSPATPGVEDLARGYMQVRIWAAPATIGLYALNGWLIAQERTRAVLAIQLVLNAVNAGLDLLLVLGLGMGVGGVAAASLVAEWTGFALALWICRRALIEALRQSRAQIFDRAQIRRIVGVNADILIRSVLLQAGFTSFIFLSAREGDTTLAANQVLLQFLTIAAGALDGFAFSAEALVGQAAGAGSRRLLRRAAVVAGRLGLAGAVLLTAVFLLAGPMLIDLMAKDAAVRETARLYLPWMALLPVLSLASWIFDGIFIGATRTRDMRNAMIVTTLCYAASLGVLIPAFGNHGLWAGITILNAMRGLTLARCYPRLERAIGV